ncbi:hypothetical protein PABG_03786 [Paracoccidioides brasiliensis Pb03]|nr:hypothetical protein PABG_03786 [Paracoccidioides brasiliensis Pb03]
MEVETLPLEGLYVLCTFNRLIELARISNRLCDYDPSTPKAAVMTHESLLRNLKEWAVPERPYSRVLDSDASSRNSVSQIIQPSPPIGNMNDIIHSLRSGLREDINTQQPASRGISTFFSYLSKTPMDQIDDSKF